MHAARPQDPFVRAPIAGPAAWATAPWIGRRALRRGARRGAVGRAAERAADRSARARRPRPLLGTAWNARATAPREDRAGDRAAAPRGDHAVARNARYLPVACAGVASSSSARTGAGAVGDTATVTGTSFIVPSGWR